MDIEETEYALTVAHGYEYWTTIWDHDGYDYDGTWTDLAEVQANCIGFASRRQDEILTYIKVGLGKETLN
jgi:hypothetical protein